MNYFESHGGRPCGEAESPYVLITEYILDVIGAGATASSDINWYHMWRKSQEAQTLVQDLDAIHAEGQNSASYFLADLNNDSLQRTYGISFPDKQQPLNDAEGAWPFIRPSRR
ncbi:uncharacterized protein LAESUDRAFT_765513 [Laetiporus sulphureus 93-53]|uniref:Uncharacterized protein n=1 Tax=Laetiporus sulphureus 93-53 TaxID=1314785 RepID=A0A165AQJ8_9APHY|nr:uncharacterized protein LAESUDRAFT_765513 [Laetiporus sulphureus 93-53]KZS99456.1 hypothetical protein LAESUDRAFT_765513 [Laetiporus sulphureus 93-53]